MDNSADRKSFLLTSCNQLPIICTNPEDRMPPVKSLDKISEKWKRASSASQPDYEDGVRNPRADWATQTKAAEQAYEQGVQKSIQEKRFGKGVNKAGTQKWQENTLAKGPSRWAAGIALSTDAYERAFQPYREVIERTQLPARGPKGDPKNIDRVRILAAALHTEKQKRRQG